MVALAFAARRSLPDETQDTSDSTKENRLPGLITLALQISRSPLAARRKLILNSMVIT
jgi:hypothetical protein